MLSETFIDAAIAFCSQHVNTLKSLGPSEKTCTVLQNFGKVYSS